MGEVAYKSKLPPSCKLHHVVLVSKLKKAIGHGLPVATPELKMLTKREELKEGHKRFSSSGRDCWMHLTEREELKEDHNTAQGNETTTEVLIKWKGRLNFDATWEYDTMLADRFPKCHLEDKVRLEGGVMQRIKDSREATTAIQLCKEEDFDALGK